MKKRKFILINCAFCGKEKSIRSDGVKDKNYCNASCSQKDRLRAPQDHPNWKGGRRVNHNGYIEVLDPGHHRARGNGYVFEHIVVLENKLGRKLLENEQVHHKDGNKENNSPDNLTAINIVAHGKLSMESRRVNRLIPCYQCGKKIYKKPSQINKNRNSFCSRRCLGIWTKESGKGVFVNDK